MKRINHQRTTMVLGIALALGLAMLGSGCTPDHGDTAAPANAPGNADASLSAGAGNSAQPISDTVITTQVKAKLAMLEGVSLTDIGVETNNGIVTLTGSAPSASSVQAMQAAAMQVDGVSKVNTMGLQVGGAMDSDGYAENTPADGAALPTSQMPVKDTWITTKVLAKLQTVDGLDNTDVDVETRNGVVNLSGRADSQALIDAASAAAKTIKGVKSVDTSALKVGPDTHQ